MYWHYPSSEMPRPTWNRVSLAALLPAFLPHPQPVTNPLLADYCRFYGLDLERTLPGVEHYLGHIVSGEFTVAVHEYRQTHEYGQPNSRGTVFVLHGYLDHVGLYTRLFAHLLASGFNVVSYDLPGHGLSSGDTAAIGDFSDYQQVLGGVMEALSGRDSGPWFAIGQSTGGAVLIDFLLSGGQSRHRSTFREVILLAPLVRPMRWFVVRRLHTLLSPFRRTWKRTFTCNSGDERFLRFLKDEDPLQSRLLSVTWVTALKKWIQRVEAAPPVDMAVTVVQGQRDRTVDWPHNLKVIRSKFPGSRVFLLPEGHHHLVNERKPLLDELFALIDKSLPAGTSAAQAAERAERQPTGELE